MKDKIVIEDVIWFGVIPVGFVLTGIFLYFYSFNPSYIKFSYVLAYLISLMLYVTFTLLR